MAVSRAEMIRITALALGSVALAGCGIRGPDATPAVKNNDEPQACGVNMGLEVDLGGYRYKAEVPLLTVAAILKGPAPYQQPNRFEYEFTLSSWKEMKEWRGMLAARIGLVNEAFSGVLNPSSSRKDLLNHRGYVSGIETYRNVFVAEGKACPMEGRYDVIGFEPEMRVGDFRWLPFRANGNVIVCDVNSLKEKSAGRMVFELPQEEILRGLILPGLSGDEQALEFFKGRRAMVVGEERTAVPFNEIGASQVGRDVLTTYIVYDPVDPAARREFNGILEGWFKLAAGGPSVASVLATSGDRDGAAMMGMVRLNSGGQLENYGGWWIKNPTGEWVHTKTQPFSSISTLKVFVKPQAAAV